MIYHVYCACNNQQPEEIKRGVYVCTNCHNDVNPADFAQDEPELSDEEIEFYQEAGREYAERIALS